MAVLQDRRYGERIGAAGSYALIR